MSIHKILLKSRLILEHNGKVLLMQQTSQNGGKYTLVGGTVEDNEFAVKALIREVKEEAGIDIKEESLTLVHTLHKKKGENTRIVLYFKATIWEGRPVTLEREKFKKVAWFALDNLPKSMSPTVKHVFEMYSKGTNYSEFSKNHKDTKIMTAIHHKQHPK